MFARKTSYRQGYTLPEVVVVICILGIIFVIAYSELRDLIGRTRAQAERKLVASEMCEAVKTRMEGSSYVPPFNLTSWIDATDSFEVVGEDDPTRSFPAKVTKDELSSAKTISGTLRGKYWIVAGKLGTLCVGLTDDDGDEGYGAYLDVKNLKAACALPAPPSTDPSGPPAPAASTMDIGLTADEVLALEGLLEDAHSSPCAVVTFLSERTGDLGGKTPD